MASEMEGARVPAEDVDEREGRNAMLEEKQEEELLQKEELEEEEGEGVEERKEPMMERGDGGGGGVASGMDDDIDKPVLDFIRSLERHCRACEDEGKYAEAEAAYTRWDELWVHEETRRRYA